jgi:hypothetical protein
MPPSCTNPVDDPVDRDEDEPEVIRAHEGNEYPEHAMTAADAEALIPKITG